MNIGANTECLDVIQVLWKVQMVYICLRDQPNFEQYPLRCDIQSWTHSTPNKYELKISPRI